MHIPYTYHLYNKVTKQHYYGARYAKNCHPNDLWKTYFSSSPKVKRLREQYGDDSFIAKVKRTFNTAKEAVEHEAKMLNRLNAIHRKDFINRNVLGAIVWDDDMIQAASERMKRKPRRKWTEEEKKRASEKHKGKPGTWNGRNHTKESIEKMREKLNDPEKKKIRLKKREENLKYQEYIVTFPDGHTERVSKLKDFCIEHDLNKERMWGIVIGNQKSHRGFTISRVEE